MANGKKVQVGTGGNEDRLLALEPVDQKAELLSAEAGAIAGFDVGLMRAPVRLIAGK